MMVLAQSSEMERELIWGVPQTASPARQFGAGSAERARDVLGALVIGFLLLPVLVVIALVVFVTQPGPIIFAHRRVGLNGKTFKCYKFRTMYVGAEQRLARILAADPELQRQWARDHKLANDPRITPIGHFLRVTSLDELPQLFNVIVGDMSLVGPRPIVEAEMPRYGRYIAHYLDVRPGLTGLWQVMGRSSTTYRRRVAADVLYVRHHSLVGDFSILLGTIPMVLAGRGAC